MYHLELNDKRLYKYKYYYDEPHDVVMIYLYRFKIKCTCHISNNNTLFRKYKDWNIFLS